MRAPSARPAARPMPSVAAPAIKAPRLRMDLEVVGVVMVLPLRLTAGAFPAWCRDHDGWRLTPFSRRDDVFVRLSGRRPPVRLTIETALLSHGGTMTLPDWP